ncbi:MAG TPA: isoprenylcysteine carboxylmethyltransferase family protein [Candidatus Paceibacterota bacterium]|nr:isoprenylcysteine carboxylmethyltransferase family protein [Candidatus Paceibacterota bacterium]
MNIYAWIIVGCWTVFLFYWIISSFSVKRDVDGSWWGWGGSGWRLRMLYALVLVLLWRYAFPDARGYHIGLLSSGWMLSGNLVLDVLGAVLCVLGIALAIWARVHLGANWSSHPTLKENHALVTSGPYALIRHPIYTGVIVAALGSVLVSLPWILLALLIAGMFVWRVKKEEALMTRQFPDQYLPYKARTWALIPWVW